MVAGWLTTQRDIGSGLVSPRPGPPAASRWLAGPVGLAARLQRTALLGWAAGMVVLGAAFGSLGEDVKGMIEGNPELEKVFTQSSGGASIVDAYFGTVLMISALIGTGFTVSSVTRLRSEETALRVEPLLATPLGQGPLGGVLAGDHAARDRRGAGGHRAGHRPGLRGGRPGPRAGLVR